MKKGLKSMLLTGVVAASLLTSGCNLFGGNETEWLTGNVAPTENDGEDGNFYYDVVANKIYYKENGIWIEQSASKGKDISKIEKVDTNNVQNTYKITYTDGTTDVFEVNKNVDLIDYTQEELYEEFLQIAQASMDKNVYNIYKSHIIEYEVDGNLEIENADSYQTVDENGMYFAFIHGGTEEYNYYFKSENKYIKYLSTTETSEYIDEQTWTKQKQNIIKQFNDGLFKSFTNVFSSETIAELIENIKINILEKGGRLPLNPSINLKKEIVNQKEKLTLEIKASYTNMSNSPVKLEFTIKCVDNLIESITHIEEWNQNMGGDEEQITERLSFDIGYFTNAALVPSTEDLNALPTPTE